MLINEFGDVGLDHLFVEKIDGDMIVMNSAAYAARSAATSSQRLRICCDVATMAASRRFAGSFWRPPASRTPRPVLHTIMYHPYLMLRYRLDGVVTLIDAVNGEATLDAHEEAVKQAAVADRLVIAKTDLPEGAQRLSSLEERLQRLNPAGRRLIAARGEATADALLDCGLYDASGKIPQVGKWLNAEAVEAAHASHDHGRQNHEHGDHNHDHAHADRNRHDDHIRAFCMTSDAPLAPASFDMFLDILRQAHGPRLLRVKELLRSRTIPSGPW